MGQGHQDLRRKRQLKALAAAVCGLLCTAAFAQDRYPARPVRLIVPYPPGGANDIIGRLIGGKLTEGWGYQVVVENRPGSAGNIGAGVLVRSAPDGYTLMIGGAGTLTVNPSLYRGKLPFDTLRDFAPLSLVATLPLMLVVHPSLPVKSVRELVALARSRPGELNFSSPGSGTPGHLAGELFKTLTGVTMVHVPYKGGALALVDLLAGHVHLMFDNMPVTLPHVRAGRLRGVAVTSLKRSPTVPELPTVAESGIRGFEIIGWWGALTVARTPQPIVDKLSADIQGVVRLPDVQERLSSQGFEPVGSSAEQFVAHIRSELAKWEKVVRESGARAD